jgi:alkylhydroperoxidase family enzyme
MVETRGLPAEEHVTAFLDAGFTERDVLEVVLAIAVKTISNFTNHLFHTSAEPVFARRAWEG